MTDNELNELVARKLGWRFDNDGHWHDPEQTGNAWGGPPPHYSTSIAAAWEISEFMKDEYFSVSRCLEQYEGHRWQAQVGSVSLITEKVMGFADTAPRAICEAFLKLP